METAELDQQELERIVQQWRNKEFAQTKEELYAHLKEHFKIDDLIDPIMAKTGSSNVHYDVNLVRLAVKTYEELVEISRRNLNGLVLVYMTLADYQPDTDVTDNDKRILKERLASMSFADEEKIKKDYSKTVGLLLESGLAVLEGYARIAAEVGERSSQLDDISFRDRAYAAAFGTKEEAGKFERSRHLFYHTRDNIISPLSEDQLKLAKMVWDYHESKTVSRFSQH